MFGREWPLTSRSRMRLPDVAPKDARLPTVGVPGTPPGSGGPELWDVRWVTNDVGLLEMQEWNGSRWVATGEVRNPVPATGGGGSTPRTQFPSEQERDEAAAALARAQALNLQTAEEREADRLLTERMEKLRVARGMAGDVLAEKGRQSEQLTNLAGRDLFKFTAQLRGGAAPERTPADVHKQNLGSFINAPLPMPEEDASVQQLDDAIRQLQELSQGGPQAPGFGFAEGTNENVGILVGEGRDGEGLMGNTAEVLELTPDGRIAKILPIKGRAANGLEVGTPENPFQAEDFGGFRGLFGSLRQSAGLPRTLFSWSRQGATPDEVGLFRSRLGMRSDTTDLGPGAKPAAFQAFGGPSLSITGGLKTAASAAGQTMNQAQLDQLAGLAVGLLPAPHRIGNFFSKLDPTEQFVIIQAYELAGIPEASFRAAAAAPAIQGRPRGLVGVG